MTMQNLDFDSIQQAPDYYLAKGGPGSGWAGPPIGTHLASSEHIESRSQAADYWAANFGGKTIGLNVHFSDPKKEPIPIKVRFDQDNDHGYTADAGGKQKTGLREFDEHRAKAMCRILSVIEHPKARARNNFADLLFEAPVNGKHYTVVLTWRSAAKVYEFHSSHFKPMDEVRRLWRQQDSRKNEGPLQKGGPFTVFAERHDSTEPGDSLRWLPPFLAGNGLHDVIVGDFDSLCKAIIESDYTTRYRASHEPTVPQLVAGNYAKRKLPWHGMTISVENEAGSVRCGVDPSGKPWETRMLFPYGYLRATQGCDGDAVDVYVGPNPEALFVYVIHQRKAGDWFKYDEDKCFCDFASEADAVHAFLQHYNDFRFLGPVTAMPVDEFVRKARATLDKPAMIKALDGLDFGQDMLTKSEHSPIPAGAHWITVNGGNGKGNPILVMPHEDGSMRVIGGAGGALNHLKLRSVKTGEGYKESIAKKQAERQAKQKEQTTADKVAGIYDGKQAERGKLKQAMRKQREDFVNTVADAMGWTGHKFDDQRHDGLSPEAEAKARKEHDADLFKRAKEAVNVNRKMLLNDHDALAASGLGDLPLQSKSDDVLSVSDLDPVADKPAGLGFATRYGDRAGANGLTPEAVAAELADVHGADPAKDAAKVAKTAEQKVAAENISKELESFKAANPETVKPSVKVLDDAKKAAALVLAHKKLKMAEQLARHASLELANAKIVESKAYILEASDAEVEEGARKQMEQDIKTIGAAGLLSEIGKMGGEESLGGHVGAGAFNSLNAFATAVGGEPLIDRSVVDVLGINAAAQVLARRMAKDYPSGDFDAIKQGVEDYHVSSQAEKQQAAVSQAQALSKAASEIELPDGATGFDLAHAQELNHKRREAVNDAKRILGQATGELQANAALVMALRVGAKDNVEVSLGKLDAKAAITQLHALGLKSGDYKLDNVGGNLVATVNGDGLDRLAKPVDVVGLKQIKRNLGIIRGDEDEDGWLPQGFADRPDLAMHVEPGVAVKLAKPFAPGPDLAQSLKDYVGGRIADGASIADVLADAQSADFFAKAGDPAAYRAALDAVAPLRTSEIDDEASGQHIRYHVTAAHEAILREGFKPMDAGGVGVGGGGTSGHTFTYAGRDQANNLHKEMQNMEAIRVAKDPIGEAAKLLSVSREEIEKRGAGLREGWDGYYKKKFNRDVTDRDVALHAGSNYIPFHSFANIDGPKRDFKVMPVDVSSGKAVGGEKDGEERWEPSSIKPVTQSGKLKPIDSLKESFEKMADDFVSSHYGPGTSALHRQGFEVNKKSVDALHRALSETPEGVAAFKPIGDLTPQERNGLRKWWEGNVGKKDAGAAGLKADLADHEKNEPEKESTDMFGESSVNPDWHAWKSKRDDLAGQANSAGLDWNKYVGIMGSPANAIAATQDLVRSRVVSGFAQAHNRLNPDSPLKVGKTTILGSINHLDAVDPAARAARQEKEKALIDSLRERVNGKYASGSVSDKIAAQAEAQAAFEQAQMGFFSTEDIDGHLFGDDEHPTTPELGADERFTVGHAAEQKIAGMMSVVGQNFKPGKPTKLWHACMGSRDASGKKNPDWSRQRLIKMLAANGRVMAAFGTGSGKSALQLAGFTHLHAAGKVKKGIIIAPSIVVGQFGGEATRYLEPGKYKWHAEPGASFEDRLAAYKDPDTHFSVVTHQSFRDDMLRLGAGHAGISKTDMAAKLGAMSEDDQAAWSKSIMEKEGFNFDYMTTDESQYTLNREGKENSGLANVVDAFSRHAKFYMPSSGDPIKNDPSEAFDLMRKLDPARYKDRSAFMRMYGGDTVAAKAGLKREMARYFFPSKITPDVIANKTTIPVELNQKQNDALALMHKDFSKAAQDKAAGKIDLDVMKRISPSSFQNVPDDQHEVIGKGLQESLGILKNAATQRVIDQHPDGAKLDEAVKQANQRKGKPGIIFARNLAVVDQIKQRLEKEGHRVVSLTGADSAADKDKKRLMFNPESGDRQADVMVLSDAGATGLNLQSGSWCLQYDTPMTAMTHAQRQGRVFRIGQKNDVELMDLAANHKFDRTARARLKKKYALREMMTSPMERLDDSPDNIAYHIHQRMLDRLE